VNLHTNPSLCLHLKQGLGGIVSGSYSVLQEMPDNFFFLAALGFELRASRCFVMDIFELGPLQLSAQAGFEPRSS
jgi:hypothetical protein